MRQITLLLILGISITLSARPQANSQTNQNVPADLSNLSQPRDVQELLLSLPHVQADTSGISIRNMPLIFSGLERLEKIKFLPQTWSYAQFNRGMISGISSDSLFLPSRSDAIKKELLTEYMLSHPERVQYMSWLLPEPPKLIQQEDKTDEFLIADVPVEAESAPLPGMIDDVKRTNWLHKANTSLQFSQAYLSPNWYQGGTNNLSLLLNLFWGVKLNEVYHPSLMFESTASYKLGLNSTPQDSIHKYSVSEDIFQYNLKFGVKALHKWFYSATAQFKTQFLNVYGENSRIRKAAFLSPGELNVGLGMTYATTSRKGKFKLNVSLAPLSYNLKSCIDSHVDPTQFGIEAGHRTYSQIGSSAESTLEWTIVNNISLRSRLFLFTDYSDFQGDWENTLNFSVNRFLSTQIYLHLRYDTSSDVSSGRWRNWMLKEILSFGFQYSFSTK